MKVRIGLACLFFVVPFLLCAQSGQPSGTILTADQAAAVMTPAVLQEFAIHFPIRRVYAYSDRSGKHYCVLTEKLDSVESNKDGTPDTLHRAIRAIDLKEDSGRLKKIWEMNDFAMRDPKSGGVEQSIWFWTKFVELTDFDGDGLIDPVLVYGSRADDEAGGRIKFLIYYKGKKIAIRHQDSDLDEGRSTEFDKDFYGLPGKVKAAVKSKIIAINKGRLGIFEEKDLSF